MMMISMMLVMTMVIMQRKSLMKNNNIKRKSFVVVMVRKRETCTLPSTIRQYWLPEMPSIYPIVVELHSDLDSSRRVTRHRH